MTSESRVDPANALLRPIVLVALAVWIVNDHWAKAAHPGLVTGKLSDVAGLIVFPLVPIGALALWRRRRGGDPPTWACSVAWLLATAALMTAIKLLDPAAWAYRHGLAAAQWPLRAAWDALTGGPIPGLRPVELTMDPSDLLTLPALLVPWILLRRTLEPSANRRPAPAGRARTSGRRSVPRVAA